MKPCKSKHIVHYLDTAKTKLTFKQIKSIGILTSCNEFLFLIHCRGRQLRLDWENKPSYTASNWLTTPDSKATKMMYKKVVNHPLSICVWVWLVTEESVLYISLPWYPLYPLYVLLHGITWQAGFHNCELFVSHEVNLGAANGIPTSLPRHLHPPWERLLECDSWPKMDRRNGGAFDVSRSCWICMIWDEIDDDVLYCYQTKQSRTNKTAFINEYCSPLVRGNLSLAITSFYKLTLELNYMIRIKARAGNPGTEGTRAPRLPLPEGFV